MTYSEIKSIANILHYISMYISDCIKNQKWNCDEIENSILNERINLSDSQIKTVISHIKENLHSNITLADGAKMCNMSVSQFMRVFKKETGKTFKEFVTLKKIEKAKFLLKNTGKSISEIADELGMEDSSYFTKVFKKYTGTRPKDYK